MANQTRRDLARIERERVGRAKAILGPRCDTASVGRAVRYLLVRQERQARGADILRRPTNKQEKAAVGRVAQELRRLNAALNNPALPEFVGKMFPPELREHENKLEALARLPLDKPKRSSDLKRQAAGQAAALLQEHELPLITTRGGKFHRLAAALYGKDHADLFNHCRFYRDVRFD